jgi:hypothetical protein
MCGKGVIQMSVILFSPHEVYKELADAYEGLKHLQYSMSEEKDMKFYKSLRRLYFANVATFLCQYHDDTPLDKGVLTSIDAFQELDGKNQERTLIEDLSEFLQSWGSLRYNLTTNDGEAYRAQDAYDCINELALFFSREVALHLTNSD